LGEVEKNYPESDCTGRLFPLVDHPGLGWPDAVTYLEELESIIVKLHGYEATPVKTVPVTEMFRGKIIWTGEVVVFALRGHPRAGRCYARGFPDELGTLETTTILEIPPVLSPEMAVRVALASRRWQD
jgi:hypothetical protein